MLIQSRTQQLSAASCWLYSLLPPAGAGPSEGAGPAGGEEEEPLLCLAAASSSAAAEGLIEAEPLKVNPEGARKRD